MGEHSLNVRAIQHQGSLAAKNGVVLEIRREIRWVLAKPGPLEHSTVYRILTVMGEVEEKGRTYRVSWAFDFPEGSVQTLSDALSPLIDYARVNSVKTDYTREAYVDVFDWLRVGYEQSSAGISSYYEFKKDAGEPKIRAEFEGARGLIEVRDMIMRAF